MFDRADFNNHPWNDTSLGPCAEWPRQLHFMCDLILGSKQPMFMLWGSDRAFIYNAAYQAIWGRTSLDTLGRPIQDVAGPIWQKLRQDVERVFQGHSFTLSNFGIRAREDEPTRYFDFSYTPIPDYDGTSDTVVGVLCISTDVTERIVAAEETREDREVLALTMDNVTEGVALVEFDFTLVLWNHQFGVHFGYEPEQIRAGMNARELMLITAGRGDLGEGDPEVIVDALIQAIQQSESGRMEVQRSDGTVLSLYRRAVSAGRYLLVSQDVTEARTAARLKDELVSTVSHELRTPLTAISGALGIVSAGAAGELSAKAERLIDIAQRNSERLIVLVNDLLDIDKLRSGRMEFHLERLDLAELIGLGVDQNMPFAEKGGVDLKADLTDQPVVVMGDRHRLLQVLANLISNAVKFSSSGGIVTVRLRTIGQRARLSVIDHGMGVAESFRDRLFNRFSQFDSSSSRVQQGTGLGLAICKSIVDQLGGTIWLDTGVSSGATFHVELPLVERGKLAATKGDE
ncbi:PAS domain-containing sensor histidine kinase [Croceibacterium sp. LX-88]|jgi:signal transduction histidine kinase|uniref:histidine kinase n=1 Tax=Croceibacterium selenioxidans TaxID=2838833 RepID=A0ABS5VZS5_9SPHN|nr:PAS domain-containing sensor histidine kinase [Croceibacterium selenioxidans]MBT2133022.1 PAS domain-containing sensor histidine kinase [Croceibacterium selenioxidans]